MKNISINFKNNSIELTNAFAKKASIIGSEAYRELKDVKSEYPNYKIVVLNPRSNKSQIKGITLELMRKYAERKNDGFINELNSLVENKTSFFEIKQEFIKKYPQFKNYKTKAEWILAA